MKKCDDTWNEDKSNPRLNQPPAPKKSGRESMVEALANVRRGKLIVATDELQQSKLHNILHRAQGNGVDDMQ